ncbi:MAG: LacI family DNA-binding transcriptional regulator [Hyphomicrobiaceae bacterium]
MAQRPTIKDLAREAGVGVATVDRVINKRANVRPETAERVAEAAERIGYHAAALLRERSAPALPRQRLGFLFPKQAQPFYKAFARTIENAVAAHPDIDGRCIIRYPDAATPAAFETALRALAKNVDAIGATAINHPTLTRAVEDITSSGIPVFSLLNDFAQGVRRAYLGTNNMKVGRIAAWMLATQIREPGKLAVFVGGHRWHSHHLRETGFRSYIREFAPDFEMIHTMVNLDTRQLTYEATIDLLSREPRLRGLYIAGGGMEGAIAALRETRPPGKVVLVVNEDTTDSRAALMDRYASLAISTPLDPLCRRTVDLMVQALNDPEAATPGQVFMSPDLLVPESV